MESRAVGLKGFSGILSLTCRDNRLNEKAYQRAIANKNKIVKGSKPLDLYLPVTFKLSENILPQQLNQEKLLRETVIKMQNEINNHVNQIEDELMVH